ncbi:MAG: ArsR family transcriptional regulator [Nitrosopumilaceae archaeon]|uniref:ArsR family transcriptional regulator n=1 Tax=Candidatus Nitrosomaritimum aestuariumsis TaxID=3342354 RepID=A0AC60W2T1_9ARCH|nr:ArsR family transcriptional regulator [Nitrosopumilaceae archaeon]
MTKDFENSANYFLELASEQRLMILNYLSTRSIGVTQISKHLDATPQEIHRNLNRLNKVGFVKKGQNDKYEITTSGKIMLSQMSLVKFLTKNKEFFESHDLSTIPSKFTKRLGVLESCTHVKGVTAVLDKWMMIYSKAKSYVFDVVSESPPGLETPLIKKIEHGVSYRHVIAENLLEAKNREKNLKKMGYYDLISKGKILRKKTKTVPVILLINESQSGIIFSSPSKTPDLAHMFYGTDPSFHEWCIDYFETIWKKSTPIRSISK